MTADHPRALEKAAQLGWEIARLHRVNAIDRLAALNTLDVLYRHPHARIRKLAIRVAEDVVGRPAALPEPQVEVFAR